MNLADMKAQYDRDGFYYPIDVMSREQAASYRAELEGIEAAIKDDKDKRRALRRHSSLVLPFVDEIARLPSVLDPVEAILGPDILLLDSPFFIKEARSPHFVAWHQDLHYWGLDKEDEVTAWIALSPATAESGCMRFVAGSHRQIVEHNDTYDEQNLLTRGQELAVEVDEKDAVDAELQPGQMSLHHGRAFHASNPNGSTDRRIGLAIRFVSPSMQQADGTRGVAVLVRGEDRFGHFELAERPKAAFDAAAIAQHQRAADIRNAALFNKTA
ncbi:MAG: phytanoyl-CoA dioxygenase family protein [Hyphomicrobiaceae bacterium]|nr:phytanoyl-CoA dioxygenase family protein [Hyphomicrobiaceae bacterium]